LQEIKHFFHTANRLIHLYNEQDRPTKPGYIKGKVFTVAIVLSDRNSCLKIVHRNISFRQNLNIMAKLRFTKYFSFLSTVYVDNFVDKEEISQFIPCNKV